MDGANINLQMGILYNEETHQTGSPIILMILVVRAVTATEINVVDSFGIVGAHTSLVLDSSGNPVISYYDSTNGDLKLVHCDDPNCEGTELSQTVDAAGIVGAHTSLVLDSSGNPVIAYTDTANRDLKLVHCDDPNCAGVETPQTVDSADEVGLYTALILDSSGNPVISYYDNTNDDLKLVHCDDPNCAGVETPQTVDSSGNVGVSSSLVLDSSGNPVISYSGVGGLRLVHCDDPNCAGVETPQLVDANGGTWTSLVLDSSGNPVISYSGVGGLHLVHCDDPNCIGVETPQIVDSDVVFGWYSSLALDSSGNPVISYFDNAALDLRLVHCDDPGCTGTESVQIIDGIEEVGYHTSLALDSSGNPVISYTDGTNGDLKLAHCTNPNCVPDLTYAPTILTESSGDDGSIDDEMVITLSGDTFTSPLILGTDVTVTNIPPGLSAAITRDSATQLTLTLTGNATSHGATDSIDNLTITFADTAFTNTFAANVINNTLLDGAITFFGKVSDDDSDDNGNDSSGHTPTSVPQVSDPAISKIGFLRPGEIGVTGERIEWVVTVSNPGDISLTNVVVTDTINSAYQILRVEGDGSATVQGQTVRVIFDLLSPGQTAQFSILTTVVNGVQVANTVCLNADDVSQEYCATAPGPVDMLPETGETPPWRAPIWIALGMVSVILMRQTLLRIGKTRS